MFPPHVPHMGTEPLTTTMMPIPGPVGRPFPRIGLRRAAEIYTVAKLIKNHCSYYLSMTNSASSWSTSCSDLRTSEPRWIRPGPEVGFGGADAYPGADHAAPDGHEPGPTGGRAGQVRVRVI